MATKTPMEMLNYSLFNPNSSESPVMSFDNTFTAINHHINTAGSYYPLNVSPFTNGVYSGINSMTYQLLEQPTMPLMTNQATFQGVNPTWLFSSFNDTSSMFHSHLISSTHFKEPSMCALSCDKYTT